MRRNGGGACDACSGAEVSTPVPWRLGVFFCGAMIDDPRYQLREPLPLPAVCPCEQMSFDNGGRAGGGLVGWSVSGC